MKTTLKSKRKPKHAGLAAFFMVVASAILPCATKAGTYTWIGGNSGTWDKTSPNWSDGTTSGVAWQDGNTAVFPGNVSVTNVTLGVDVTVNGLQFSGEWSLGGAHTITLRSSSGNFIVSQASPASLTLKDGITVSVASACECNIGELNIENATLAAPSGARFHNGWNNGTGLTGGAAINVRNGGVFSVYEFVPSPSSSSADVSRYAVNVTTGGVLRLDHLLTQYNLDITRYSTFLFDGGTLEGLSTGEQFTRPSDTTRILLGAGGMRIAGNSPIFIRTAIGSANGDDGGITIETGKLVRFLSKDANGLPTSTFTGPVRFKANGARLSIHSDRNLGAVPASPEDAIVFEKFGYLETESDTAIDSNRNILIGADTTAMIEANGCSLVVKSTISGNAPGAERNGTLSTDSPFSGRLSLEPFAGRTNSIGRLLVKKQSLTIGGEGVTEITDTLSNLGATGENGVLSVSGGATLSVTGGLVRVVTNRYTTVAGGNLSVYGGTLDLSGQNNYLNAHYDSATTTVGRAGVFIAKNYYLSEGLTAHEAGLTRLETGGTLLLLEDFYMNVANGKMTSKARIDFDGGVLAPQKTSTSFLGTTDEWFTNVLCVVKEGGAVISNDVRVWTHHPLVSGAVRDGGLHKWGTSDFASITTGNTFNGPIVVHQGTLIWGNANNYPVSATLVTHKGAYANLNNCAQTLARVEGDGVVQNCNGLTVSGAVAPGHGANSPGTLNFWHRCVFDDCLLEIDPGDVLSVNEQQDISGLTLHVNNVDELDRNRVYTILSTVSGGDFSGTFKGDNLSGGWEVRYDHKRHVAYLKHCKGTRVIIR